MDSMLAAIKAKRGGSSDMQQPASGSQQPQSGGLNDLVDSLDDNQKQELLMLLTKSQEGAQGIEKGEPSNNERKIVGQKAAQENMEAPDDSDDIAMSMIDRNSLQKAEQGVRPRGLGDRAKMAMAEKLKGKGKLK